MHSQEVETITKSSIYLSIYLHTHIHTYTTHLIYCHAFGTLLGHELFNKEDNNDIATYIHTFFHYKHCQKKSVSFIDWQEHKELAMILQCSRGAHVLIYNVPLHDLTYFHIHTIHSCLIGHVCAQIKLLHHL